MAIDWDINDTVVPKINAVDLNPFNEWPDGHCRLVYTSNDEEVKKHSSGWAMRNTNNHNVNILKKSCLGVILCSLHCVPAIGNQIHIRPAICDKARKKQRGKACPNGSCNGRLYIQPCRGHCGYPVTHFWRKNGSEMYFQAKGTHDHPRPEPKGSNQSKQLYTKRKTSSLDLLKRKSAVSNKLSSLRAKTTPRASHQIKPEPQSMQTDFAAKDSFIHSQSWPSTINPTQQFNNRVSGFAAAQTQNAINYGSSQTSSGFYNQEQSTHDLSPQAVDDLFHFSPSDTTLRPEDIFQIDQPIRSSTNNYAGSSYSNSMSPSSSSRSPPATFTELESTSFTSNTFPYPSAYFNQVSAASKSTSWPIKFETFCDSSLTSISQQFDENYSSIQQLQPASIPTADTSSATYYTNNEFFNQCEQVANLNGADHDSAHFYSAGGFDMDYDVMGQQLVPSTAGSTMTTSEWTTMDNQSYGNYGLQANHYPFDNFQQSQYLSA